MITNTALCKSALLATLLLSVATEGMTQTYDFNNGTLSDTSGALQLAPFNPFGSGAFPPPASGSLSVSDGLLVPESNHFGNGTSQSPELLGAAVGPNRIGFFNPVPSLDFEASIDVVSLGDNDSKGDSPAHLLGARLNTPGLGTTSGVYLQIRTLNGNLHTWVGNILQESLFPLPDQYGFEQYILNADQLPGNGVSEGMRMTFSGRGSKLTASVSSLALPDVPLITITREDMNPQPGLAGYVVARSIAVTSADAELALTGIQLDNFSVREPQASEVTVPELDIKRAFRLFWEGEPGQYRLERTSALGFPWVWVSPKNSVIRAVEGGTEAFVYIDRREQFFRLVPVDAPQSDNE